MSGKHWFWIIITIILGFTISDIYSSYSHNSLRKERENQLKEFYKKQSEDLSKLSDERNNIFREMRKDQEELTELLKKAIILKQQLNEAKGLSK